MMARRQPALLWFIFVLIITVLESQQVVSQEIDGILYIFDSKAKAHIIKIDLTNPHIKLQTVLANGTGKTTEQVDSMARRHNAIVAINGDYFGNTGAVLVEGTTYVNGTKVWGNIWRTYLAISQDNQVAIVRPADQPNFVIYNAIGGGPWIVWGGEDQWERSNASNCPGTKSIINGECYADSLYWDKSGRPQSAIGITQDGHTLILVVATASSPKKIAKILVQYGAWTAMKLDSGGSSALFYNGRVLHTEGRAVANALVVLHDVIKNPIQSPPISNPPTSPSCKASPKISVNPKSGAPGTSFTVKWKGFSDNGTLISHLQKPDGTEYPTKTFTVDNKGTAKFVIDSSSFTSGQYNLWAEDTCTGKRTKTVSFTIKGSAPPPVQPPAIDSDNDGIPDNQDQCPYQWGPAPTGCPAATQPPAPPTINQPPWAQISVFPTTVNVGERVTIQAVAYGDPEGQPLVFDYDFGDGTVISSPASGENHSYSSPGTYSVRAKVRDPQGAFSYTNSVTVTVIGSSSPPPSFPPSPPRGSNTPPQILDLLVFPSPAIVGERVLFTAIVTDQEPGQLSYYWSFGQGEEQGIFTQTASIDYIYHSPDVYTVCVLVVDAGGLDDNLCTSVDVLPPFPGDGGPPPPPGGFSLRSKTEMIDIAIYDVRGALVYQLEDLPPHRRWQWDMRDATGVPVPNSVYLAVITVRDLSGYPIRREVRKIVVLNHKRLPPNVSSKK